MFIGLLLLLQRLLLMLRLLDVSGPLSSIERRISRSRADERGNPVC